MQLRTDPDRCVGSGNCVLTAPDLFDQDDDGVVTLLTPHPPSDRAQAAETAVLHCPAGAIRIEND